MDYDLEINSLIRFLSKHEHKRVLLQLPDGLKRFAKEIVNIIESKLKIQVIIWGGTNFGACDIPLHTEKLGIDIIIHYGHNRFIK